MPHTSPTALDIARDNDAAVRAARETLAYTSTAVVGVGEMSRTELCSLIGRLTGSLLALAEYVDLTQRIAGHEQATRETQARIDAQPDTGTHVLTTTVTDDEHGIIQGLAELAGVDMPTFLRSAALASHGGHVATIAGLYERCDNAERGLLEIIHTVKRIADGTR